MKYIFSILVLISIATRWDIGWDFPAYINIISNQENILDDRIAPISKIILFLGNFTDYYQISLLLFSLPGVILYSLRSKNGNWKINSFFYYFGILNFLPTLSLIRQGLAINLFSLFVINSINKRYILSSIFLLASFFTHSSAIIAFLLLIIFIAFSFRNIVLIIFFGITIINFFDMGLLVLLLNKIPHSIINELTIQQYTEQINSIKYGLTWYYAELVLIILIYIKNYKNNLIEYDIDLKLSTCGVLIGILLSSISADVARISLYFCAFLPFIYSKYNVKFGSLMGGCKIAIIYKLILFIIVIYVASNNPIKNPFYPLDFCFSETNECILNYGFK
jgi:hypothetical protein